ncbi:hypothetical protein ACXR6G_01820 [Ancylomarina sp. YFZ004]
MKKNILKYILVMFLAVSFASCDDFDQELNYYDTAKLDLSASSFTVLDTQLETTIDFQTTTKTVGAVRFVYDGNEIGTGTATNNKVTATFNRSDLDLSAIDDASRLYVYAMVDGKEKEMYTTIDMVSASSIKDPFVTVDDEEETDPIFEMSDVVKNFTYKVSPETASGVIVTASIKVNDDVDYTELWSMDYDAANLNWGFKGADYVKGDEISLMLVATVGTFTDTVTTSITVSEYLMEEATSSKIDMVKPGFDLVETKAVPVDGTMCMLEFTHDFDQLMQGFDALNGTEIFLITDADLKVEMNLPVLKAAFDVATTVTTIADAKVGDRFIVKTVRDSKDYYGTIKVTGSNDNRKGEDDFLSFDCSIEVYDAQK